jgi:DNA replicative helicase MCM subunit Mcm2 (Cdc46/Mcm family)
LAEAVARIKLADTVTRDDVSEAIRLMNVATQTVRRACSNAHAAMRMQQCYRTTLAVSYCFLTCGFLTIASTSIK